MTVKTYSIYSLIFCIFLISSLYSCKEKNTKVEISREYASEFHNILNSDKIVVDKHDKTYDLNVYNTKLKTQFGRKMTASVASIILYEQIAATNNTLDFTTKFQVKYINSNEKYLFKLENIKHALKAEEIIHNFIKSFSQVSGQEICLSNFEIENLLKIESEDLVFAGFEQKNQSICGINRNVTIWRTFINNKQILFYVDNNKHEVVEIEAPEHADIHNS